MDLIEASRIIGPLFSKKKNTDHRAYAEFFLHTCTETDKLTLDLHDTCYLILVVV